MHNYVLPQDQLCRHTGPLYSERLQCLSPCLYQDMAHFEKDRFQIFVRKDQGLFILSIIFSHMPANYSEYTLMYVFWSI